MSREWKPGDVAMLLTGRIAVVDGQGHFVYGHTKDHHAYPGSINARGAIPLVVINPEDAEQVERLRDAYVSRWGTRGPSDLVKREVARDLTIALREFARPTPKPDEPQGLGAVVEDAEGRRWVRAAIGRWGWLPCNSMASLDDHAGRTSYAGIDAVHVLSEGVTPEVAS